MKEHLKKYLDYIRLAENPTVEQFDEDWEPVGPRVRENLRVQELAGIRDGRMFVFGEEEQQW